MSLVVVAVRVHPIIPVEKRRSRSSPRCGCGFLVKYSAIKTASVSENVNGDKVAEPIKVTAVNFNHSNGCCPSAPQLLLVNKITGLHTRNVDRTRVFPPNIYFTYIHEVGDPATCSFWFSS
jgi:hypothetical protein